MSDIQSKVLIVKPVVRMVGKTKTDKEITSDIHSTHAMDDEAGQYVKKLYPMEFIAPFTKIIGGANRFHLRNTILSQFGYLIPTIRFEQYKAEMQKYIQQFDDAADDFCQHYDTIIEKARVIHNGTFREEFYPHKDSVRSCFSYSLFTSMVPRVGDLAVSYLDEERIEQIRQEIVSNVDKAGKMASQQVIARVLEKVDHIVQKLSEPEAVFRNSLIDNLREILVIAPSLNIADDPKVSQLIAECNSKLVKDPDVLRNNEFQRNTTAILARQISNTFGGMGARKLAA